MRRWRTFPVGSLQSLPAGDAILKVSSAMKTCAGHVQDCMASKTGVDVRLHAVRALSI